MEIRHHDDDFRNGEPFPILIKITPFIKYCSICLNSKQIRVGLTFARRNYHLRKQFKTFFGALCILFFYFFKQTF